MTNKKQSGQSFQKALRSECEHYARHYGYNEDELNRGFEAYTAHLFAQENGFEEVLDGEDPQTADLSEIILRNKDLGIDAVLEDTYNKRLLLVQASWGGRGSHFPQEKTNDFFAIHSRLLDAEFVATGSEQAQRLLDTYSAKVRDGYSVIFRFVTNRSLGKSDRRETALKASSEALRSISPRLTCELLGQQQLKELTRSVDTSAGGLLTQVKFSIHSNEAVEFDEPRHSLICRLKGNVLTNLYQEHSQGLFALNIRLPMTLQQATNREIRKTASESPEEFFFYNNGVSAVCSSFEWDQSKNLVVAERFQIINGAQTVGSVAGTDNTDEVAVLFRLTETGEHTGGKFTESIIRYNNTQNPVKIADFRSNDPIQSFLQRELTKLSGKGPVPRFSYVAKRGTKRGGRAGRSLSSEELAKLRHAFLDGPVTSFKEPKSFFDNSDDGRYWEAFGVDGQEVTSWPEERLAEAALALAIDDEIKSIAKKLKAQDKETGKPTAEAAYLSRMSRYVTALVRVALKDMAQTEFGSFSELISNKQRFGELCSNPIAVARRELRSAMAQRRKERDEVQPEYNLARDARTWSHLADRVVEELRSEI